MTVRTPRQIRVGIVRFTNCSEAAVHGLYETFMIANLVHGRRARAAPRVFVVAFVDGLMLSRRRALDVLVVPPTYILSEAQTERSLRDNARLTAGLAAVAPRIPLIAAACSGVVFAAEAGLLVGKSATTSWWLASWFRRRYATTHLDIGATLVKSTGIWTTAAYSSFFYLALELVERFMGERVRNVTAKLLLLAPRALPQAAFLDFPRPTASDGLADAALRLLLCDGGREPTIHDVAATLNVSERTLARRILRHTGSTPHRLVQRRLVERAKKLLRETDWTFERITAACGRDDPRSFRRLFVSDAGIGPAEYRRRFSRRAERPP